MAFDLVRKVAEGTRCCFQSPFGQTRTVEPCGKMNTIKPEWRVSVGK